MSEYQSLAMLSQEWLAKARECEEAASQEDIGDEEALLYKTSAQHYRECEERLHPFIAAAATVIDLPKLTGDGTSNGRTTKPEMTGSPSGTPHGAGDSLARRWEVGKNGWDASDEATREDI